MAGVIQRWRDTDDGDEAAVALLRRRADSLRQQIREVSEVMTPPQQRQADAVEEASARARQILAQVAEEARLEDEAAAAARARMAEDGAAFYAARGPALSLVAAAGPRLIAGSAPPRARPAASRRASTPGRMSRGASWRRMTRRLRGWWMRDTHSPPRSWEQRQRATGEQHQATAAAPSGCGGARRPRR